MQRNITVFYNAEPDYTFSCKSQVARKGSQPRNSYGRYTTWNAKSIKASRPRRKETNWNIVAIVFVLILAGFVNYVQSM